MKSFALAMVAFVAISWTVDARAQRACNGGGQSLSTATGTSASAAALQRAYARQQATMQQLAYLARQWQWQREQLVHQETLANDRSEARQRKLAARRERRLAAIARREAARQQRLAAQVEAALVAQRN